MNSLRPVAILACMLSAAASCRADESKTKDASEFRQMGVCIAADGQSYDLESDLTADFYLVEVIPRSTHRSVATIYVGHNPRVDPRLIFEIRKDRLKFSARGTIPLPGTPGEVLGVPSNSDVAYFHVIPHSTSEAERLGIVRLIRFCPESAMVAQ